MDDARKVIEATPPDFSFTFYLNPNPQKMGGDPAVVFPRLLAQTEGWLGFIVHSVAYRIGQFVDDLVTGIDEARPRPIRDEEMWFVGADSTQLSASQIIRC